MTGVEIPCPSGHPNPVGARFCARCGQPVEGEEPTRLELPPEAPTSLLGSAGVPAPAAGFDADATPPSPLFHGPVAPDPAGDDGPRPGRGLRLAVGIVVLAVVVAGAALAVISLRHHHGDGQAAIRVGPAVSRGLRPASPGTGGIATPAAPTPTTSAGSSSTTSTPPSSTAPTGSAASQISAVVSQSAQVRPEVSAAISQVASCATSPAQGEQVLQQAITTRTSALSGLSQVDASALTDGQAVVADLTQALQASSQADQDYLAWMMDGGSCQQDPHANSDYAAGDAASAQADAAKEAFVALWNPIAQAAGEPTVAATDF